MEMKRVGKCMKPILVKTKSSWGWGGGVREATKDKVAQNGLKHILVSEFLKSNEIFEIR